MASDDLRDVIAVLGFQGRSNVQVQARVDYALDDGRWESSTDLAPSDPAPSVAQWRRVEVRFPTKR
jgi:hypothetical protein